MLQGPGVCITVAQLCYESELIVAFILLIRDIEHQCNRAVIEGIVSHLSNQAIDIRACAIVK